MKNRIQLVVNAGSSADTIRPADSAPPQMTGARKSLTIGSFSRMVLRGLFDSDVFMDTG
jgi:hypothetical protein